MGREIFSFVRGDPAMPKNVPSEYKYSRVCLFLQGEISMLRMQKKPLQKSMMKKGKGAVRGIAGNIDFSETKRGFERNTGIELR